MAWQPETYYLKRNQHAPNNAYPVLVYRQCLPLPVTEDKATEFLERHAWEKKGTWGHIGVRHFHPNVHECYGVIAGQSTMLVGCGSDDPEDAGRKIELLVGDVIVLPAGTGHCSLKSTKDYLYVGLYPAGGPMWRAELGKEGADVKALRQEVDNVALPAGDPVLGKAGPLMKLWVRSDTAVASA
ncbi:hypothetical protein SEUCBS139899_005387 [Sporothrix eucalyptigena]|uniref:Cupin type-1 domain-containing protein n=1 Tax=Sporothrix eucalyptigena TaxID=1812306 RepID=A0ABP0CXG1_9PEZI